jgi:hypothetical protein
VYRLALRACETDALRVRSPCLSHRQVEGETRHWTPSSPTLADVAFSGPAQLSQDQERVRSVTGGKRRVLNLDSL